MLVLLNASDQPAPFELNLPGAHQLVDVLNGGEVFHVAQGSVRIDPVWPHWVRVLRVT